MNLEYFKEQIKEELEGAKDYIIKAMELKPMNPSWSKQFADMSSQELNHAKYLYDLFNDYYKTLSGSYTTMPEYIDDIRDEINEIYTDCFPKVKIMQEMYIK